VILEQCSFETTGTSGSRAAIWQNRSKVTPTPARDFPLAKAHVAAIRNLRGLHGSAFDRAFLKHEVDFHNAVIDAVTNTLLPATQNAQVKDLETKVAPAFVAHRDLAQRLLNEQK